jgi:tetratricopeptide (TPR) repeat protein
VASETPSDTAPEAGPLEFPRAVIVRDPRLSASRHRSLPLIVTEIEQLEALATAIKVTSPDRPALLRRVAEGYVELEDAALATDAGSRQGASETRRATIERANKAAIKFYNVILAEYGGQPSATFPGTPPPAYPKLDAVYYFLAYEYERAGDLPDARRVYLSLITKTPSSSYTPLAYLAFGELFFAEAKADPSKWELARQAYEEVLKSPPPANRAYAYAWYRLAQVFLNLADKPHAADSLQKAMDAASQYPDPANVADAARVELTRLASGR